MRSEECYYYYQDTVSAWCSAGSDSRVLSQSPSLRCPPGDWRCGPTCEQNTELVLPELSQNFSPRGSDSVPAPIVHSGVVVFQPEYPAAQVE